MARTDATASGALYLANFDVESGVFETRSAAYEGDWTSHQILAGDVDGDGDDDLAHGDTEGAKKVILTAPGKGDGVGTYVVGVNADSYSHEDFDILSNASCTTNCLAPIVKVLDQKLGINKGLMTTIHSYTGDQRILDNAHRDLRRARAAAMNLVPTSTGAAKAVALVYPQMKGKLTGIAMRVPTPNVSAVDLVFESSRKTSAEEVNSLLKTASQGEMKGIIKYGDLPLVSTDYAGTNESTIVDEALTMCIDDNMVKVLAWYYNEWCYSQRFVYLAEIVAQKWK